MDVGFLILNPERNVAGLKSTLGSIRHYAYNRESICIVGNDANTKEIKEMKEYCQTHKGENTMTSLINVGMKKMQHDWAFLLFSGSRIPTFLERKFSIFCKDPKDVLFPVVDGKYNFVEGSFNGVLINTKTFREIGEFPDVVMENQGKNDFEIAKMFWAAKALEHGIKFKAIVGMRII